MRSITYIIITLSILLTTGCSPMINKYRVTIDAISNPSVEIQPSSYVIKALGEDSDEKSLKFQRQSRYLAQTLNEKGYTQTGSEALAQQIIYFDYGIETVKDETRTYSEPSMSFGFYHRDYYSPFWSDFGYTHYRTYRKRYLLFNRYMVILSKDQTGKELWRVDTSSIGESDNLKVIIPLLIKASKPYIGKYTEKPVKVVVKDKKIEKETEAKKEMEKEKKIKK